MNPIDRLPPVDPATWTETQRSCAEEIIAGPRGALISPFVPLLRSPELCTHAQRMGEYLRYRSAIGLRLSELAILVTASHWDQQVEWSIHVPIALREGIDQSVVDAIAERRTPVFTRTDEQIVYAVSQQSLQDRRVDDATWAAACAQLGEQGVVDLTGIVGYYTMLSIVMNGAQTPPPPQCTQRLPARC
ncbi:MAG: carboxymuconolactone decarboxylase family protein [Rubrivivax sp.]|nr:carboxymuconolactone decarboxylase family protein [Rubrivivax sp.]MDP3615240.1 carboxymuconolactone decarboxylase family protein [Rubrivivax sp.]